MTLYTVTWNDDAVAELAAIWLTSNRRDAITRAASELEQHLRNDASTKGQSLGEMRLLLAGDLLVAFAVSEEDRLVKILQVWSIALPG